MKHFLVLAIAGALTSISLAEVPNTFAAGEIATASKFNENFMSLSNEIEEVRTEVSNIKTDSESSTDGNSSGNPDGSVIAKVNGVDMKVSSYMLGMYSIVTPTGKNISVNAEGYPASSQLVYESKDCTGDAYIQHYQLLDHKNKEAGHVFANPKLSNTASIVYVNGELSYSLSDTLTKIHYSSIDYGNGGGCFKTSGTSITSQVVPNDPEVTGIESVPLIITGVGSELSISSTEVGTPSTGGYNVYANGTKIGTTTSLPTKYTYEGGVYVNLNGDYEGKRVNLHKDGTYSGYSAVSSSTLYYKSNDCSGNAYVKVFYDGIKKFIDASKINVEIVTNNGSHYALSDETYRVTSTSGSYKSPSSYSCYSKYDTFSEGAGYKIATRTSTPNVPVFTPPITIEGYEEPTPYDQLPVVF